LAFSGLREVVLERADGSGTVARLARLSDRVDSILFSRDGKLLIADAGTPAEFGEVQFWDAIEKKLNAMTLANEAVSGVRFRRTARALLLAVRMERCGCWRPRRAKKCKGSPITRTGY
jgi:hypothetical protein